MNRRHFIAVLSSSIAIAGSILAADQAGAEKTKKPIQAHVVDAVKNDSDFERTVGNIEVTYEDGTKDRWTTKRDCGLPEVAANGTVGWVVYKPEVNGPEGEKNVRVNNTVTLCRKGKVLGHATTSLPFIEEWRFADGGVHFATKSRALHGPADLEFFDTATGKRIASAKAYDAKLPEWAKGWNE